MTEMSTIGIEKQENRSVSRQAKNLSEALHPGSGNRLFWGSGMCAALTGFWFSYHVPRFFFAFA